jgi:hypothetical protein
VHQVSDRSSKRNVDGKLIPLIFKRAGKAIHAFRDDPRDAQQELKDQMLIAAALWGRVKPQLLVLRRTAPSLGEEYLNLQIELLDCLERKLKDLTSQSEKLLTMPSFQKYVVDASR